ncbi:MAG: hypothetical protein LAO20_21800 [Acidobacteriia bacterium]|nr:hypothetical protein [Terriglobia bacterium]
MHEHYQELCAAASLGQAEPEDLALLDQHMAGCAECRRAYADYLNIAAHQFSLRDNVPEISEEEAELYFVSAGSRQRVLLGLAEEGIAASPTLQQAPQSRSPLPVSRPGLSIPGTRRWSFPARVAAGLVLAAAILGAFETGKRSVTGKTMPVPQATKAPTAIQETEDVVRLTALNARLESLIEDLRADLKKTTGRLTASSASLQSVLAQEQEQRTMRDSRIQQLQQALADAEAASSAAKDEAARLQTSAAESQANDVAARIRSRELADQLAEKAAALDRERQLLQGGRDIRELMVARNLHIVDVFDTDAKGKTRPAFGRVFYTEGKSLIFYAYDLNEAKLQQANYHYRVWGGKEGHEDKARSLGIFYSDDRAQRRWVFRCDDSRVLSEIDSVFVTLEPPGADASHPKGQKLMDAYLRGVPNHP